MMSAPSGERAGVGGEEAAVVGVDLPLRVGLVDGVPDLHEVVPDGGGVAELVGVGVDEAACVGLEAVGVEAFVAPGGQEAAVFGVGLEEEAEEDAQGDAVGEREPVGVEWDGCVLGEALATSTATGGTISS